MIIIREVNNWKFIKDEIMGVTTFTNEDLKFQSLWNTGIDAEEEIEEVNTMSDSEFISYIMDKFDIN
jgi:hypothetical protein